MSFTVSCTGTVENYTLAEFLKVGMEHKILLNVVFSPLSNDIVVKTYKIMPRACNAYAYLNAGFSAKIGKNAKDDVVIEGRPTIVYGGISPELVIIAQFN